MGAGGPKAKGSLLYQAAFRVATDLGRHQDLLVEQVASDKLQTAVQLEGTPSRRALGRTRGGRLILLRAALPIRSVRAGLQPRSSP